MATTTAENETKKPDTEKVILDLFEDDDELEEFQIDLEWDYEKDIKFLTQQWEDDWDDDDVNDDFSSQLKGELETNSEKKRV